MHSGLRSVGAVIAGAVAAYAIIMSMELLTSRLYPMPVGTDIQSMDAMREWIRTLPTTALLMVVAGWAAGAFVGGMLAARLAARAGSRHALSLGVLLLIAGIANLMSLPHPLWMWVAAFVVFVPAAFLGARLVENKPAPAVHG